jgi:hypothetical protein
MKVQYQITEDDYAACARFNAWRHLIARPSTRMLVTSAIVVALLGLRLWKDPRIALAFAYVAAIYAAFIAYRLFLGIPRVARQRFRQYKAMQGPITAELTDAGVRLSNEDAEGILPWPKIYQWRQNDQFVLIYMMPGLFHIVPKSIAQAGFDIPRLVQQLAEHVGPER